MLRHAGARTVALTAQCVRKRLAVDHCFRPSMRQPPSTRVAVVAGRPPRAGLPISASAWQLLMNTRVDACAQKASSMSWRHRPETSDAPMYCRCMFAASPAESERARHLLLCDARIEDGPAESAQPLGDGIVRYRYARRSSMHAASRASPSTPRRDAPHPPAPHRPRPRRSGGLPGSRRSPRSQGIRGAELRGLFAVSSARGRTTASCAIDATWTPSRV